MASRIRVPRLSPIPLALLALLLASPRAEACGGLFCDNLPDPMAVDQNREDILFAVDGDSIEVHVRIAYTGEAERFAWVVPIQAIPEVEVGTDALFNALEDATAPRWSKQTTYECEEEEPPPWGDTDGTAGTDTDGTDTDDTGGGGPQLVFEDTVGSYEVIVLQGGTAQEVVDFLNANSYQQDPEAVPIMQEYLDEGFLFAAVKLSADASVNEIHPLAFTFPGDEPCIPLRLTRIAAEDDMQIRAYFLGDERWAPSNYAHVVLNPLAVDWSAGSTNGQVRNQLSQAIDDAGGRAFATEYAGNPGVIETASIYRQWWEALSFEGQDPVEALQTLSDVALVEHPMIIPILLEFVPPPDGVDAQEFWNFIFEYEDLIDQQAWDPIAFGDAIQTRIVEPARHAVEMLEGWPKLTRMRAIMSPGEMTVDPVFHQNPDLPNVSRSRVTEENMLCGLADRVYHVDIDGTDYGVCRPENQPYPDLEGMPAALRIEQMPMVGPPQVVTDNRALIDSLFTTYDESVTCTSQPSTGTDGDSGAGTDTDSDSGEEAGTEDGGEGGGESGSTGGDGDGGSGGDGSTSTSGDDPGADDSGTATCGCSTPSGQAPFGVAIGLLLLGLIGPWRRRT